MGVVLAAQSSCSFTLQLGPKPGEWGDETIGGARAGVIPWPLADGSGRFAAVLGEAR